MSTLSYIILFTFLSSVCSLIGGVALLFKEKLAYKISHLVAAFAAGALLGTAFFDLLPEAAAEKGEVNIFLWTLVGILVFFLLERIIHWFHHHQHQHEGVKPTVALLTIGDSVHNFIDGVVVAATFMTNIPLGIVTALAVAAHELPQEIGDFGLLLHAGLGRKRVFLLNFFSALAALVGALLTYFMGNVIHGLLPVFLSLTAGFFIYIAASDLIPEIHHADKRGVAFLESFLLLVGVCVVYLTVRMLEH